MSLGRQISGHNHTIKVYFLALPSILSITTAANRSKKNRKWTNCSSFLLLWFYWHLHMKCCSVLARFYILRACVIIKQLDCYLYTGVWSEMVSMIHGEKMALAHTFNVIHWRLKPANNRLRLGGGVFTCPLIQSARWIAWTETEPIHSLRLLAVWLIHKLELRLQCHIQRYVYKFYTSFSHHVEE
jgi:hypothetical protein